MPRRRWREDGEESPRWRKDKGGVHKAGARTVLSNLGAFALCNQPAPVRLSPMLKRRVAAIVLLLALVFLVGILGGLLLPRLGGLGPATKVYNTPTLLQQVKTLSELVTVQYVLEKVVVLEVPSDSMLGQMFAGENRVLLLAHGIVKAGIDFSQLQPSDLKVGDKKITIRLPAGRITDAYLDDKQTRVIERKTGFFRAFDKDLEQTARLTAIDDLRRAARSSGIVKDAEERARAQVRHLFEPLGFEVEFSPR